MKSTTLKQFVKDYKGDPDNRAVHELVIFFLEAAKRFPMGFIDKAQLARIAWHQTKVPSPAFVEKNLGSVLCRVNIELHAKHRACLVYDKIEGVRSTHNEADYLVHGHRGAVRKLIKAGEKVALTDSNLDITKLPAPMREEVLATRKQLPAVHRIIGALPAPQQPAGTGSQTAPQATPSVRVVGGHR